MKAIDIKDLQRNAVAEVDYYGRDGKILIKQGVMVDESLLNAIFRRNISKFFVQEEGEDIKKLLQLQDLDEFEFEADAAPEDSEANTPLEKVVIDVPVAPEKVLPVLATIKRGEEGVKQILKSQAVQTLEEAIEKSTISLTIAPVGTPLKNSAQEIDLGARTQEYKAELVTDYDKSLEEVKDLLIRIKNGKATSGNRITGLVKGFVKTYLNDKHMLLNLANVKSKEPDYIYAHSLNVSLISISIAASRGFDQDQIVDVGLGGLLHDVGALFIPDEVRFKKKEPLNKDEIFEIQKHPMIGIHLIEKIKGLPEVAQFICYQSHERENREGYPKQRNGRLIHDYAKIVSVADVYESLTADRPYRQALVPYKAMEYVLKAVKMGFFNSEIVKYYLEYTSLFPVGSLVKLTTGEIGKVIRPNSSQYARPVISVIIGSDNRMLSDAEIKSYDLSKNHDIKILQAIDNNKLNIEVMKGFYEKEQGARIKN